MTAQTAGLYLILVTMALEQAAIRSVRLTQLYSTLAGAHGSGYSDQRGFLNVSDIPPTGTLSLYSVNNGLLTSVQFTIPPGGEVVRGSSARNLNLPTNRNGYATFSHNGPPGAVVADAYMISPTGLVVPYVKFEGIGSH